MPKVHNITGTPGSPYPARAFPIAGQMLRAGSWAEFPDAALGEKEKAMHGTRVWIGDSLPDRCRVPTAPTPPDVTQVPMTREEIRAYLGELSEEKLRGLCAEVTPPLVFGPSTASTVIADRLSRVLLLPERIQDPAPFFWLRRWRRIGNAYQLK